MKVRQFAPYFSPEGYRDVLHHALEQDYRISCFRDFHFRADQPQLLLRHDLDHSLRSAVLMADWEKDLGIQSTYFIQVACPFYNLLSPESRRLVKTLIKLGHEVGLHYEAERYLGPRGRRHLEADIHLLEDLTDQRVVSASQHIPTEGKIADLKPLIPHEAYESRFRDEPMTYISDSLMAWRQATPHDLVAQGHHFQLLTHPMKWCRSFSSLPEALDHAYREECDVFLASCVKIAAKYEQLRRDRKQLDARFCQQRNSKARGDAT